jgi:hypothetical protein
LRANKRHGNPQISPALAAISTKVNPEYDTVITMTAQETTLFPHRLARSAQDLARASLSGVARELKDPRMAKQIGGSSQQTATARQYGHGSQSGEIPRSRPALYSRENSFRNQPNASASRAAEEEFVRFQEKDSRPKKEDWLSSDLAGCVKIVPPEESSGKHEQRSHARIIQNESLTSHHLTSGSTAKDRANDAIDSHFPRADTNAVNDIKSGSRANGARAAAARRLEQIGAQMQRNLAMQLSQQDASIQNRLAQTTTTTMDRQHESAHQTSHPKSSTPQSSSRIQSTNESHRMSQQTHHHQHHHHHHHQTPPSSHENEDDDDEKDDSQLHFHCPYYACHQNLRRLLTNSSGSGRRRSCVHTGCGERLETRVAWNEHITLPHHNLQG